MTPYGHSDSSALPMNLQTTYIPTVLHGLCAMRILTRHTELGFWVVALAVLACTDPAGPPMLDLCIFKWIGITCPGCGIGHGIAYLLDLQFSAAIDAHPLAPFATFAIAGRIIRLWPRREPTIS